MAEANLAGRETRLGATLIDALISASCVVPVILGAGLPGHQSDWTSMLTDPQDVPVFALPTPGIPSLVILGYLLIAAVLGVQLVWLATRGQTIGKRILKIKIVKTQTGQNGDFVSNILMRVLVPALILGALYYALKIAFPYMRLSRVFLPYVLYGVPACLLLTDLLLTLRQDRCRISDLIAGTHVVNS